MVPTMIASISSGSTFAISQARRAARTARSLVASPSAITWRSRIPVRSTIHWSFVSTSFSRSALVRTFSGANEPVPATYERIESPWGGSGFLGGHVACGVFLRFRPSCLDQRVGGRDGRGDLFDEVGAGRVADPPDRALHR